MKKQLVLMLSLLLLPSGGLAQEWNTSVDGKMTFATRHNAERKTPLVFDPDILGSKRQSHTITPVITFDVATEKLVVAGQARSEAEWDEDDEDAVSSLDEFYAEYAMTDDIFVFVGRRNTAFGQAESTYALDVFLDPFEINRAKNIDRQRQEIVGEDMAGFEVLLTPEITFAGYYLPEQGKNDVGDSDAGEHPTRGLAVLSWLFPWQADVELLVLDDERDGIGLAYSQTVGDALLLYAEGMRRDGRDRSGIDATAASGVQAIGTQAISVQTMPESGDFSQFVFGGNYVFENSLGLTAEYYHNENGYSDEEWDNIAGMISAYNASITHDDPRISGPARGGLLNLNSTLRHYNLRQNYGFLRLSHPELFGLAVTPTLTALHNFDDDSGTLSARFETELGNGVVGLYAASAYGNDNGEFKLRSPNQSAMIYWTLQF